MDHHGPCVGQGLGLDSPDEAQQACGMIGHAVVRPTSEVELPDLPDLMSSPLRKHGHGVKHTQRSSVQRGGWWVVPLHSKKNTGSGEFNIMQSTCREPTQNHYVNSTNSLHDSQDKSGLVSLLGTKSCEGPFVFILEQACGQLLGSLLVTCCQRGPAL